MKVHSFYKSKMYSYQILISVLVSIDIVIKIMIFTFRKKVLSIKSKILRNLKPVHKH